MNTGLVLEGGGMRGAFTAGVLEYLMEQDLYFPYVIGVSAGACNASSYISRQMDRNRIVTIDYARHPEYISFSRFLKQRELFGMDFIFNRLPNELVPFDFDAFGQAKEQFVVGATDVVTGQPVYFDNKSHNKQKEDILTILRASSSLPFMAPPVDYKGLMLMDGGISDPIPVKQSVADGNKRNVVIMTRNEGHVKKKAGFEWFIRRSYPHNEGLIRAIMNRHDTYNRTVAYLEEEQEKGNVLIIRPTEKLDVSRIERNPKKLENLYKQGYDVAKEKAENLKSFLGI